MLSPLNPRPRSTRPAGGARGCGANGGGSGACGSGGGATIRLWAARDHCLLGNGEATVGDGAVDGRDGGAGAINSTRGHDLFLVAVDDGVQAMRRPQLQAAAATEDDAPPPTPASAVDWLRIK